MERMDLLSAFQREVEVLELTDDYMIYALDQKNELKDLCSIEQMTFADGAVNRRISLDYTRLWESFRTYGQMPDFFYAVNVLADYRVRLRRIRKDTWENDMDILVNPEGEIINIYSLNEDFMVITDEVKATDEVCKTYGIKDNGRRYVNVRYLYEIKTARKYPVLDSHFDSLTENFPVCPVNGVPTIVYEAFYRDEKDESKEGMSEILAVAVDEFIAHVKADGMAGFKTIAAPQKDGFDYVRVLSVSEDCVFYRQRCQASRREQIVRRMCSKDGIFEKEVVCEYEVPPEGSVFYDVQTMNVYYCPEDEDASVKTVRCLNRPEFTLSYDGKYGTFSKVFEDELLVTTYFDEVFVKEYEYHEYAALHDLKTHTVETIEGRTESSKNRLVLLRSFLAL